MERADEITTHSLAQSVEEVDLLLTYTARAGLEIPPEMVETIVKAKAAHERGDLDSDLEGRFWTAYQSLAAAIHPVGVDSIKANDDAYGTVVWSLLRGRRRVSQAGVAVRRYQRISMFALLSLLVVQIYTVTGATVITDLENVEKRAQDLRQEREKLERQRTDLSRQISIEGTRPKLESVLDQLGDIRDEYGFAERDVNSRYWLLLKWSVVVEGMVGGDDEPDVPTAVEVSSDTGAGGDFHDLLRQSRALPVGASDDEEENSYNRVLLGQITLEVLNVFLLPLLYGWLGACAYVLRSLSRAIRAYEYSPAVDIRLKLRMYLGALAGFSVAWFINTATTPGLAESITPLALAFLAGYSVEILFAGMDNLVATFSRSQLDRAGDGSRARGAAGSQLPRNPQI